MGSRKAILYSDSSENTTVDILLSKASVGAVIPCEFSRIQKMVVAMFALWLWESPTLNTKRLLEKGNAHAHSATPENQTITNDLILGPKSMFQKERSDRGSHLKRNFVISQPCRNTNL